MGSFGQIVWAKPGDAEQQVGILTGEVKEIDGENGIEIKDGVQIGAGKHWLTRRAPGDRDRPIEEGGANGTWWHG